MSDGKSPWGSSGGSSGSNSGGRGSSLWGSGGGNRGGGQRPPRRPQQPADLDNVIRGFKDRFGGGKGNGKGGGKNPGFPFWIIGLAIVGLIAFTSIFTVQAEEEAVVLRFGEYKRTVGPGLHFKLPDPIETKIVEPVTIQQETKIGIRSSGQDVSTESLMLTGDENIVDIDFTVLWRIDNLESYLFKIDDPEQAVKAVGESVMREVIGKNDLDVIITTEREKLRGLVQEQAQTILDEYNAGVRINDIQFQKTDPPSPVMQAFLDVVNADQKAESLVNEAQAYQNKNVLEAEGEAAKMVQEAEAYKEQVIAEATGEAERFRLVYEEYKRAPKVIRQRMYMDVMKKVYEQSDKIVLGETAGQGVVPYLPLNELNKKGGQ